MQKRSGEQKSQVCPKCKDLKGGATDSFERRARKRESSGTEKEQSEEVVGFDTRWKRVWWGNERIEKKRAFRRLAKSGHESNWTGTTGWLGRTDME